jgi:hypothetical protein
VKTKIALTLVAAVVVIGALTVYVGLRAGADLMSARRVLSLSSARLNLSRIQRARADVRRAIGELGSPPARVLKAVPVVGQNLDALDAVARATVPVLKAGMALETVAHALANEGLMHNGAVRLDMLRRLRAPVRAQASSLAGLEQQVRLHRNGWLVPPLWNGLDDMLQKTRQLREGATAARNLVDVAPRLLGASGSRTYLVVFINNSELRGAGGLLSGVGTLSASRGRLRIGAFHHYKDLADPPPYRSVPAPPDFTRNFGRYQANTTRWLAATSSPDVPDVALVASRLYKLTTGVRTDGVIVIDPRGMAALMPPHAQVKVPGTSVELSRTQIPAFVYSREYKVLANQGQRRDVLIGVGRAVFGAVLGKGLRSLHALESAGAAFRDRHIRFVSLHPREESALESVGTTSNLGTPPGDGMLVTVQNYGGTKLDYWSRRVVAHSCTVTDTGGATCSTTVTIHNDVPRGLPRFVYQYKPYGLFKNFVEVYAPGDAVLTRVNVDGKPAHFYPEREDGYKAAGVYVEIPRGTRREITVGYRLPARRGRYSLVVTPQALSRDAKLAIDLKVPSGWTIRYPNGSQTGELKYSTDLTDQLIFEAAPDARTGLPALWQSLVRFWTKPVL